jgi:exosome complex component RRP42
MAVSVSERSYVQDSLLSDFRTDGRSRLDWRTFSVAADVAPQANGSARIRLGGSDILAACRLEVEEQAAGSLDVFVDWCARTLACCITLALASAFAHSTPAALAVLDTDVASSISTHIAALFSRSINGHPQLAILPGHRAWQLSLDLTIFAADGGNLLDLAACAARCALVNLRIPRTRPVGLTGANRKAGAMTDGMASLLKPGAAGRAKGKMRVVDFELESYWDNGAPLKGAEDLPVSVTLNLVRTTGRTLYLCWQPEPCVQLNEAVFIDATLQEERCAPSRLIVGVDRQGRIRLVRQEGEAEVLNTQLGGLIDTAAPMATSLITTLNAFAKAPSRAE